MPQPKMWSTHLRRAVEILREHGEMEAKQLVLEIAPLVPPEKAVHRVERDRTRGGKRGGSKRSAFRPYSLEQQVLSGQRCIARETLMGAQVTSIQTFCRDGVKYVRLNPNVDWDSVL